MYKYFVLGSCPFYPARTYKQHMKYISGVLFFLLSYVSRMHGQDKKDIQRPSLGIHILLDNFADRDSLHIPGGDNHTRIGLALNYLRGLTPHTDLNTTLAGSFLSLSHKGQAEVSRALFLEADAAVREKLFPGSRRFNPFLQAGLGISAFSGYYGLFLPAGIGLQAALPGEAFLLLHAQYRIPVTAGRSDHFFFSLGIAGVIGKRKKLRSHDPGPAPHRSDISVSASKDSDGDGIPDDRDACPLQPGSSAFDGCPDTDGDGIADKKDKCPLVRGILRLQGCPEPDRDKDGIPDAQDRCPDLPGFRDHAGCPVVEDAIRRQIDLAAKNIFFETDKYVLLPASFPALDEVAGILQQNPYLRLDIGGHTDSTGTPGKNQSLSEHRARAVLSYLTTKGDIDRDRLSATGYGSEKPVENNTTPEGRGRNRRVELRLRYY